MFLRRPVRWSGILSFKNFQKFAVIHIVKALSIVNEAEVDFFFFCLEFFCFFSDPTDVGNLISGSSAFSKSSLNICKFLVHVLLKPNLKDFDLQAWTLLAREMSGIVQ